MVIGFADILMELGPMLDISSHTGVYKLGTLSTKAALRVCWLVHFMSGHLEHINKTYLACVPSSKDCVPWRKLPKPMVLHEGFPSMLTCTPHTWDQKQKVMGSHHAVLP